VRQDSQLAGKSDWINIQTNQRGNFLYYLAFVNFIPDMVCYLSEEKNFEIKACKLKIELYKIIFSMAGNS
jgi:hypothetical protein